EPEKENSSSDANGDTQQEDVVELEVNNTKPSSHHWAYNVYEPWKEFVEEKTDGRIKVNVYHGATLGTDSTAYEDITAGVYDVGLVAMSIYYDSVLFPLTIGNLPFALPDVESSSKV